MDVRTLGEADAADFQRVFLRALTEHPEAFGVSVEEQEATTLEAVANLLTAPNNRVFGAFAGGAIVGIAGLFRSPRSKSHHRAIFGPMYVTPEARRSGVGKRLLDAALTYARSWAGLEDVVLLVTVGNTPARELYLKAGFQPYSVEPRYFKLGERYFDTEWMILPLNR